MKTTKIKLAIVGCGNIVTGGHLPAIEKLTDRYEVVAVCDPFPAAAKRMVQRLGLPESRMFTEIGEVAASDEIDAALVGTPHHHHHDATAMLISGGKHVLVEKPFALNQHEAAHLVSLAEQNQVSLVIGHCQRHSAVGLAVKEVVRDGHIGDIFGAHALVLQYLPMYIAPESNHWLYSAEKAGGGIVISVAVHKLDLLRFLLGEVDTASALFEIDESRSSADRPFEWTASINLKFVSGAVATLFACYKAYSDKWEPETLHLLGTEGTIRAVGWDEFEIISRKLPDWGRHFINHHPQANSEWVTQLEAFHDTVVHGLPNRADARDALKTMVLIDAIYESGSNGGKPARPRDVATLQTL